MSYCLRIHLLGKLTVNVSKSHIVDTLIMGLGSTHLHKEVLIPPLLLRLWDTLVVVTVSQWRIWYVPVLPTITI